MKRSVAAASLCLAILGPRAFAAEFSVKGTSSETLQASDNYFMSRQPTGYAAKSLSRIELDFLAATPLTRYALNTNYSHYRYFGPGAQGTGLLWGNPAGATFLITHTPDPTTKYNFNATWSRSDLATAVLEQTGTAAGKGTVDQFSFGTGVVKTLTRKDSISLTASVATVSFSEPGQTAYFDYTMSAAWNRSVLPGLSLSASINADLLTIDNASNSQRLYLNPMLSMQGQLSRRLSIYGGFGYGFVNAWQDGAALAVVPAATAFVPQPGATADWVAHGGMRYQIAKDMRLSFTAAKSIAPTILGQLQTVESLGSTFDRDVNRRTTVSLGTQFSHTSGSDAFTASATYSYTLARHWTSQMSYTYSQRNDALGLVRSNLVMLRLANNFTIYGKPPVVRPKTPSELALQDLQRAQLVLPGR